MSKTRKIYKIHDNGGRPFQVTIRGKTIQIHKREEDNYKGPYKVPVATFKNVKQVFVGKDHLHLRTRWEGKIWGCTLHKSKQAARTKEFDGNSLLLHLGGYRYVWIGLYIVEFTTARDLIVNYYSDVGNNDVPYPVAVGEKHAYFLEGQVPVFVPRTAFRPDVEWHDAYMDFFGHVKDPFYTKKGELASKPVPKAKIIHERL